MGTYSKFGADLIIGFTVNNYKLINTGYHVDYKEFRLLYAY